MLKLEVHDRDSVLIRRRRDHRLAPCPRPALAVSDGRRVPALGKRRRQDCRDLGAKLRAGKRPRRGDDVKMLYSFVFVEDPALLRAGTGCIGEASGREPQGRLTLPGHQDIETAVGRSEGHIEVPLLLDGDLDVEAVAAVQDLAERDCAKERVAVSLRLQLGP